MLDVGYWIQDVGYWILDTGCWIKEKLPIFIQNQASSIQNLKQCLMFNGEQEKFIMTA